jgi:hypothetical protein
LLDCSYGNLANKGKKEFNIFKNRIVKPKNAKNAKKIKIKK